MKWIFYILINLAKIFAASGLLLLLVVAVPVISGLLILGIALGFLRELEPHGLQYKTKSLTLYFPNLKLEKFLIWPTKIAHMQRIKVLRYKSRF